LLVRNQIALDEPRLHDRQLTMIAGSEVGSTIGLPGAAVASEGYREVRPPSTGFP
jgi:hypothetical protein